MFRSSWKEGAADCQLSVAQMASGALSLQGPPGRVLREPHDRLVVDLGIAGGPLIGVFEAAPLLFDVWCAASSEHLASCVPAAGGGRRARRRARTAAAVARAGAEGGVAGGAPARGRLPTFKPFGWF